MGLVHGRVVVLNSPSCLLYLVIVGRTPMFGEANDPRRGTAEEWTLQKKSGEDESKR